jgi:hypothetical protein
MRPSGTVFDPARIRAWPTNPTPTAHRSDAQSLRSPALRQRPGGPFRGIAAVLSGAGPTSPDSRWIIAALLSDCIEYLLQKRAPGLDPLQSVCQGI